MLHAIFLLDSKSGVEFLSKQFYEQKSSNEAVIDPTLISGFLNAIFSFSREARIGRLSEVQAEDLTFVYRVDQDGQVLIVALVDSETDKNLLEDILQSIASHFREKYPSVGEQWAYDQTFFESFEEVLDQIFYKEVTEFLLENYPKKIVARVLKLYPLYSLKTIEELGVHAGRFIREKSGKTYLSKELGKFSVTEFSRKKDKVELLMCPFCRGKKSSKPMCNFVTGFIRGFLNLAEDAVTETHCFACGDSACTFKIEIKGV
ncbi:MAG: V4R domain-containing protein [Promethearchaeota archaeon]